MFKSLLKNQHVTFVNDAAQATRHSPFYSLYNEKSNRWVVSNRETKQIVAAGLDEEEAQACVMFKANEYIYRQIQKGNKS